MSDALIAEKPINTNAEDLFNFKYYSKKVQEIIQRSTKSNESLVIGIYGKWGDGKTSFLNLIENQIDFFEKYVSVADIFSRGEEPSADNHARGCEALCLTTDH